MLIKKNYYIYPLQDIQKYNINLFIIKLLILEFKNKLQFIVILLQIFLSTTKNINLYNIEFSSGCEIFGF